MAKDIIALIECKVQKIAEKEWEKDECPPEFWVSLNNYDMENQQIIITINHCGRKFSEILFPKMDTAYGYDSIYDQMHSMYNLTM